MTLYNPQNSVKSSRKIQEIASLGRCIQFTILPSDPLELHRDFGARRLWCTPPPPHPNFLCPSGCPPTPIFQSKVRHCNRVVTPLFNQRCCNNLCHHFSCIYLTRLWQKPCTAVSKGYIYIKCKNRFEGNLLIWENFWSYIKIGLYSYRVLIYNYTAYFLGNHEYQWSCRTIH